MHTRTVCAKSTRLQPLGLVFGARVFLAICLAFTSAAQAARIKEVAAIEGVRGNQLTGFGLVVGLDGTGDQTTQMPYTTQGLTNYLQQMGSASTGECWRRRFLCVRGTPASATC
jgi:flagellar P-ring protein FlgI